jgi:hypothetical protein
MPICDEQNPLTHAPLHSPSEVHVLVVHMPPVHAKLTGQSAACWQGFETH